MDRLLLPGPRSATLGRAGRPARHTRGKRGEEEERTERLFMFHLELPSAVDLRSTPPGSCVACGCMCVSVSTRARAHTHDCSYSPKLAGAAFLCVLMISPCVRHYFLSLADVTEVCSRTWLSACRKVDGVFTLCAITCCSLCRDRLPSHGVSLSTVYKRSDTGSSLY